LEIVIYEANRSPPLRLKLGHYRSATPAISPVLSFNRLQLYNLAAPGDQHLQLNPIGDQ
jgi:hypothetical protein